MSFIMEPSNQYHTILLLLLPPGSTLYLYFSSICRISDNKSLHLEHTLPETCATNSLFWVTLSMLTYLWLKCRDYHLKQRCAERWWLLTPEWQSAMSHVFWTHSPEHESNFTQSFSKSVDDSDSFMLLLIQKLDSLIDWMYVLRQHRLTIFWQFWQCNKN